MFSPNSYGDAATGFLNGTAGPAQLAAMADPAARLFPHARFPRETVAGLWLLFDDLDRSHKVSQELPGVEAAFWHGIMHRREPDPGNAAYWFRRVGRHPVFPALHQAAGQAGYPAAAGDSWDPFAWIDYWEAARRRPHSREFEVAKAVQRLEWEILFDYCASRRSDAV